MYRKNQIWSINDRSEPRNLLARRSGNRGTRPYWGSKVWSAVSVPVDLLRHCVPVTIASSGCDSSSVVNVPDLGAIGTGKESISWLASSDIQYYLENIPIVTRAVVSISISEDRTAALLPACTECWVTRSVPGEQAQAVVGCPAEACRVSDVCLAAVIHGNGAFLDRTAVPFPGFSRCGKDFSGADLAG